MTEDTLLTAWREARENARKFYDRAMEDADRLYQQWLDSQRAAATRSAALSTATWEDRLAAMQALTECSLRMRSPGNWYVETSVEIGDGAILSSAYGNGETPEQAVEQTWKNVTTLRDDQYLAVRRHGERLNAMWDGDAWKTWKPQRVDA